MSISAAACSPLESLLVAAILLLVGGHITMILLHQGNPLLKGLEFSISLVLLGDANGRSNDRCWTIIYICVRRILRCRSAARTEQKETACENTERCFFNTCP